MAEEYLKKFGNLKIEANEKAVKFLKGQLKLREENLEELVKISDIVESLTKLNEFVKKGRYEPVITEDTDIGEMTNELYQKVLSEYHGIYYYVKDKDSNYIELSLTPCRVNKCRCREEHPLIVKKYIEGNTFDYMFDVVLVCPKEKKITLMARYATDGDVMAELPLI